MKPAALRRSELAAVELLSQQSLTSLFDLSNLSLTRLSLPVALDFESFSRFEARTGSTLPLPKSGAEGLTVRHGGRYLVLYNDRTECEGRRSFTLAHEIGHVLLGHVGEDEEREEREANAFAASLLAPAIVFHYLVHRDGRVPTVEEMTVYFPLSREAAARRRAELMKRKPSTPADCEITLLLQLFGRLPATVGTEKST